ncbi:hypothetical protein Aduo_007851 [Ancylostoma duodenale]
MEGRLHTPRLIRRHPKIIFSDFGHRHFFSFFRQFCVVQVQYWSDEEEEMVEITIDETDIESIPRRRSTDLRDNCRGLIQKMEMCYAATRACAFKALRKPSDRVPEEMERAYRLMEEARKIMAGLATEPNEKENDENNVELARRPDVPLVGKPQALTPIRKLHKRSCLRKQEQATKRKRALPISVDGMEQ